MIEMNKTIGTEYRMLTSVFWNWSQSNLKWIKSRGLFAAAFFVPCGASFCRIPMCFYGGGSLRYFSQNYNFKWEWRKKCRKISVIIMKPQKICTLKSLEGSARSRKTAFWFYLRERSFLQSWRAAFMRRKRSCFPWWEIMWISCIIPWETPWSCQSVKEPAF